jgi:hypothetical protein
MSTRRAYRHSIECREELLMAVEIRVILAVDAFVDFLACDLLPVYVSIRKSAPW